MLPNTSPDVQDIIDNADYPIIVVVVGNPCTEFKGQFQSTLEEEIQKHPEMVVFHVVCVSEDEVPFPRPLLPSAYYFLPKNPVCVLWRGGEATVYLKKDIDAVYNLWKNGTPIEQGLYTEEQLRQIQQMDSMLSTEEVKTFPPVFQMARNFAKEMWTVGKRATLGLPILTTAEKAYERYQTCLGCEKFDKESTRCSACGCVMKVKSHLISAKCPLSKWNDK